MSRCVVCDASSSGLSMYRPDGKYTAHKFHQMDTPDGVGDYICNECYEEHKDVEYDFNLEDSVSEDGTEEGAFEYD